MSAYIVSPEHIDYLISAAVLYRSHDRGCVNEACEMLERANRDNLPGYEEADWEITSRL